MQSLSGRSSSSSSTTTTHAQDFCFPVLLERACRITARQVSCRGQPAAQQLCKGFLAQQIPAAAAALWVAAFFRVVADAVVGVIISLDRLRIEPSHTGNGGLGSSCGGGVGNESCPKPSSRETSPVAVTARAAASGRDETDETCVTAGVESKEGVEVRGL